MPSVRFFCFMNVPFKLISYCNDNEMLRQLAVFMAMKSKFGNGSYYKDNITGTSLIKINGVSRNKLNAYMKFFRAHKWITETKDAIHFKPLKTIGSQYGTKNLKHYVKIKLPNRSNETVTLLRFEIFKRQNEQFKYIKRLSRDKHDPSRLKDHKEAVKIASKLPRELDKLDANAHYKISLIGIAELFRVGTVSAASKIIKQFVELKKITVKHVRHWKGRINRHASLGEGLTFVNKKRNGYLILPNEYTFL